MKIIHRYILFSVTGTFLATLLVLTGILCLGNLLKVADLILRGMDPALILRFFGFLVISLLEYAIPMAILTSTILVFGRLSADNEITGMRACGIGLKRIIEPVILLGFLLTLLCLYLQTT
ncbi:MAG: LptF/LptG family permease, partial [Candidatus Erginobacter occultus]|nr:LptF/LptG family permease [Candidatus Erginobacter occultus]